MIIIMIAIMIIIITIITQAKLVWYYELSFFPT